MAEHHGPAHYRKIWLILLVLLLVSFVGPLANEEFPDIDLQWLTLLTAFGIAVVKAWLVAQNFMHITLQPRFVSYIIATCLLFMLLFYAGTAGDVMKQSGDQWHKPPLAEHAAPLAPAPH